MKNNDIFEGRKDEGFFLRTGGPPRALSGEERVHLIRRGNEFFNRGEFTVAKKVFITTGYGDGLIRMGDHHYRQGELLEAFRMYWMAKEKAKSGLLIEKMAFVIREWLKPEDGGEREDEE
jgi:hypothetical protein